MTGILHMKSQIALAVVMGSLLIWNSALAETFVPTSGGPHFWNVPSNWSPASVPDAPGATAIIQSPTGDLSIDLGTEITVGTLTINKSASGTFNTTISGTATNKLLFDGGSPTSTLINATELPVAAVAGVTTLATPIQFDSAFTVTQQDDGILRFTQSLSGAGGLTIDRVASDLTVNTGVVELNAANTYAGATLFSGAGNGDSRYLVVRLNHADAIPSASPITLSNSAVLELAAGDFTRSLGTGAGQITFASPNFSGWSAFGGDRIVNLGGQPTPASVAWNFCNTLLLGAFTNNAMVDFKNPLDLGTGVGQTRSLRAEDGAGAIDGRFSGSISGERGIIKTGSGALSLAAANTYAGSTEVRGGLLRLDHADALPSGNLILGSGGVLGLGAGNFARDLGAGTNQVQFVFSGGSGNGGFSAYGANRTVVLSGGAGLVWDSGSFLLGNGNLLLSDASSDSMIDFQNPIDLNGAARTVATRNGSADVDGRLSGVLSGTGSLVKENPGTLELTAANTYDGGTDIMGGRLLVNNTTGSGTGTGTVTVNNGTLGGTGAIAGAVIVNTGAHVAPGMSIESLDVASLTLNAGSILDFELDTIGVVDTSDLINVTLTDGLTIEGGSVVIANAGAMTDGTYTLINYTGTIMGSGVSTFLSTPPTGPAGFAYSLINNTSNTSIDLVVTAAGVPGDYNGNGVVDAADYVIWRKHLGTNTQLTNEVAGVTPGSVTQEDFDAWRSRFGNTSGSGTGGGLAGEQAVPEPTTILFVLVGAPLITWRQRIGLAR
jgi:autotransporter-associated beta strand protein